MPHLALADELIDGEQGLFERHLGVVDVQVEQIDAIGAQAAERARRRRPRSPASESPDVRRPCRPSSRARGRRGCRAPASRMPIMVSLRPAGVGVGGVDEVAAAVRVAVEDRPGRRGIRGPAEDVAAQSEREDVEVRVAETATGQRRGADDRRGLARGGDDASRARSVQLSGASIGASFVTCRRRGPGAVWRVLVRVTTRSANSRPTDRIVTNRHYWRCEPESQWRTFQIRSTIQSTKKITPNTGNAHTSRRPPAAVRPVSKARSRSGVAGGCATRSSPRPSPAAEAASRGWPDPRGRIPCVRR